MDLVAELTELVADEARVTASEAVLEQHGKDLSYHPPQLPDVVVFAASTAEVSAVLAFANGHGVPVVPFGAGSSLEGHVIPIRGGISLDLTLLDRIVELSPADLTATVQAGVMRSTLNAAAGEEGLFFPVDPGADATLGGMAATNASGTTTVRYGVMRDQVLGLEVVLADGTVVRTGGHARKSSAGYDLTGLFVGSEGTLGVITELTLRLYGLPEHTLAARAVFPTVDAACRAAAGMVAAGVSLTRVELVDEATVRAVNVYKGTSFAESPTLFLDFSGTKASVEGDLELARDLADEEGCLSIEVERDRAARERLWEARHHVAFALMATAPGKRIMATDACVPVSQMPAAIREARRFIDERGVTAAVHGHVGDGNYHVAFMVDPAVPADVADAKAVNDAIVADALSRGGTCTGEHGVGLGKMRYLEQEHGDALPLMLGLKRLADPNDILNPGKILVS
jgi:D-lactate dehydrogenase (cytochrome)